MLNSDSSSPNQDPPSKGVYRSPNLVSYGNIREITQANDNQGKKDNSTTSDTDHRT